MNKYLITGHRQLEEVEGYDYQYDDRLFVVPFEEVYFLFDKATGTMIATSFEEGQFDKEHEDILTTFAKIVKTPLYEKNKKKFAKLLAKGKIIRL